MKEAENGGRKGEKKREAKGMSWAEGAGSARAKPLWDGRHPPVSIHGRATTIDKNTTNNTYRIYNYCPPVLAVDICVCIPFITSRPNQKETRNSPSQLQAYAVDKKKNK